MWRVSPNQCIRGLSPAADAPGGLSGTYGTDHRMNGDASEPKSTGATPEETDGDEATPSTPDVVRSTIWYAIGAVLLTLAALWSSTSNGPSSTT